MLDHLWPPLALTLSFNISISSRALSICFCRYSMFTLLCIMSSIRTSIFSTDLYKTTEKLEITQEQNMTNKVNIEFLKAQLEKALADVEQLKDKVRANGNGTY